MKFIFSLICSVAFILSQAQKIDNNQIITCVAKPNTTIVGGKVTLKGETLNDGKNTKLNIAITKPNQSIENQTIPLKADGTFTYEIKNLLLDGKYKVQLTSVDNKFKQQIFFTVIKNYELNLLADKLIQNFDQIKTKLDLKIEKSKTFLPPSLKSQMSEYEKKYTKKCKQYDEAGLTLKNGLKQISNALKIKPANNAAGIEALNNLADECEAANDRLVQVKKQFDTHKSYDNTVCEALTITSEACAAFSTFTNIQSTFIKSLVAISTDKVYPLWVDQNFEDQTAVFAMKEGTKLCAEAATDFQELQANLASPNTSGAALWQGLAGDILQFIADKALMELCGVWKGTLTHQYTINNTNEYNGSRFTWWKYSVQMGAALTLRYPKDASSDIIRMKGNLEGNATKFDFFDDPTQTEEVRKLKTGAMLKHYRRTPLAVPFVVASNDFLGFGAAARAFGTPSYFNIPIDAEYNVKDKKITIFVNAAIVDFNEEVVQNRSLFLYQAVLPIIRCQLYPILPAQTTIKGTLKENPTFDVKVNNGKLSFEGVAKLNKGENTNQEIKSIVNISAIKVN